MAATVASKEVFELMDCDLAALSLPQQPSAMFSSSEEEALDPEELDLQSKCIPLSTLIRIWTSAAPCNIDDLRSFLLTFSMIMKPMELLEQLKTRFDAPPPSHLEGEELQMWRAKDLRIIQLRVCNFFRHWVAVAPCDFLTDPSLEAALEMWSRDRLPALGIALSTALTRSLQRAKDRKSHIFIHPEATPSPVLTSAPPQKLTDLSPVELARQLTLLEFKAFSRICHHEFHDFAWIKHKDQAPNLVEMVQLSNLIGAWISREVRSTPADFQAPLARFLVRLLKSLHQLHNFSCLTFLLMILHGFFERATLSTAHRQRIAELESITTSNNKYAKLRTVLRDSTPPTLPYVGMYLTDLHFILEPSFDGPPFTTQHGAGVKFWKMKIVATIIQDIQGFINVPYNLQEVPEIQHFLESKLQAMHI